MVVYGQHEVGRGRQDIWIVEMTAESFFQFEHCQELIFLIIKNGLQLLFAYDVVFCRLVQLLLVYFLN